MINTKFLSDLGFNDNGMKRLPDWYNLFESEPLITEVPSYIFHIYRLTIYLFLAPKGQFVEVFCQDDPHRDSVYFHQYVAIHSQSDLVSLVNELLSIVVETNRKVDEDNKAFEEYLKTVEVIKRKVE